MRKILHRMQNRRLIKCVDAKYIPSVKSKLYAWTGSTNQDAEMSQANEEEVAIEF